MNKIEYIPHYLIVDIYPDSMEDEPFIIIRVLDGTKWKSEELFTTNENGITGNFTVFK